MRIIVPISLFFMIERVGHRELLSKDFCHGAELANEYGALRQFMRCAPHNKVLRVIPDQLDNFLRELAKLEGATETPETL